VLHNAFIYKKILCQSSIVKCWYIFTHFSQFEACDFANKGHFTALHFYMLASQRCHQIVCSLISILSIFLSCFKGICVSSLTLWINQWSPIFKVFQGLLEWGIFLIDSRSLKHSMNLVTIGHWIFNCTLILACEKWGSKATIWAF